MESKLKIVCVDIKPKRRRSAITLEEKLKIIRMYEEGKIISTIAREVKRPISTVNTIVKDRVRIVESTKGAITLKDTIITKKRQGSILEMEKLLSHWIEDRTRNRKPLSSLIIQEKARSLHKDLQEKAGITDTETEFKASAGWFDRFKKRTNLQNFRIKEEPESPNADGEREFLAGQDEEATIDDPIRMGESQYSEEDSKPIKLPTSNEKKFTATGLAEAFNLIDIALTKLESMDPDTERFHNVSRQIHSELSAYKAIYEEEKRLSTQPVLYMCVRCRSQSIQDVNSDDREPSQPSTSTWTELTTHQHSSSRPATPAATPPPLSNQLSCHQTFVYVKSEDSF